MEHLHDVICECEDLLVDEWVKTVDEGSQEGPPAVREPAERFLSDFGSALRTSVAGDAPSRPEDREAPDLGVDTVRAARAYGALQCLMLKLASDRGIVLSPAEQLTVASHTNEAVARVAEVQSREHHRDAWKVAHQLRNPLGSAMLALTMLRSRVDLGSNARLAETLERNLRRLQGLIDDTCVETRSL